MEPVSLQSSVGSAWFDPVTGSFGVGDKPGANASDQQPNGRTGIAPAQRQDGGERDAGLSRLVLNVNNFCNLECTYCYALGGDYGGPKERLTTDVGRSAVDELFVQYGTIRTIQFFGGEPLLNWQTIDELCEHSIRRARELDRPEPSFSMVTNGTVLSGATLDMIRRWDIKVTVSLDGPPEVNDQLRIARPGGIESVGRTVEHNVRRMRDHTGQPAQIEGVYTPLHQTVGMSLCEVMDYVHCTLGVHQLHMPPDALASAGDWDVGAVAEEYSGAVAKTLCSLVSNPVTGVIALREAVDLLSAVMTPAPAAHHLCPAGSGTIAVDSNGDVYPCFMYYRQTGHRLGRVGTPAGAGLVDEGSRVRFVSKLDVRNVSRLSDSWARMFFGGCAASNYFRHGDESTVSDTDVAIAEGMASAAIVGLAHLREHEPDSWNYLPLAIKLYEAYVVASDV